MSYVLRPTEPSILRNAPPFAAFTTADMLSWYPGLMSIFLWVTDLRGYAKAHAAALAVLITSITGGLDSHVAVPTLILNALAAYLTAGTLVAAIPNKGAGA